MRGDLRVEMVAAMAERSAACVWSAIRSATLRTHRIGRMTYVTEADAQAWITAGATSTSPIVQRARAAARQKTAQASSAK